jgi:hypothetical protein
MEWDFTGNIARIGTNYEILENLREERESYLREALSSTSGYADGLTDYGPPLEYPKPFLNTVHFNK